MEDFVNCCECKKEISKKRCLIVKSFGEEIICGSCIRIEQGEKSYQFYKNLIENDFLKETSTEELIKIAAKRIADCFSESEEGVV